MIKICQNLVTKVKGDFSGYQPAPQLHAPLSSSCKAAEPCFNSFIEDQESLEGGPCLTSGGGRILNRVGTDNYIITQVAHPGSEILDLFFWGKFSQIWSVESNVH